MFVRSLADCEAFRAADASILREMLHPARADLQIRYSLAHAAVCPGTRTKAHRLATAEVYFILQGQGRMHIDAEHAEVAAGCAVYIPPGSVQYIENTGDDDLAFLCIVDPAWTEADEEILEGS